MADDIVRLKPAAARKLIFSALTGAGAAPKNVTYFTEAILDTELSGLEGHGFPNRTVRHGISGSLPLSVERLLQVTEK